MKLIRWFLCKLDIHHRLVKVWLPMKALGITPFSAPLWGCKVDGPAASAFACRDCGTILAPFEVAARGWTVQDKP